MHRNQAPIRRRAQIAWRIFFATATTLAHGHVDAQVTASAQPPKTAVVRTKFFNKCDSTMFLALRYHMQGDGRWITQGWWRIIPGSSVEPDMNTSDPEIYYYVEDARNRVWAGEGKAALKLRVIGQKFGFVDIDSAEVGYEAAFDQLKNFQDGAFTLNLTCDPEALFKN